MTFEEYWSPLFKEMDDEETIARNAWNAALEEAAKIAESRASTPGSVLEAPIRSLKEE